MNKELRRELQRLGPPEELQAQRRAWPAIRAAFETREPVAWPERIRQPVDLSEVHPVPGQLVLVTDHDLAALRADGHHIPR